MGFKLAGTSPENSAENYSAVATDGYNDGPLRMQRTVVCIHHTRYVFLSFLKLGHTRRNLRRGVASATDRHRGTVARLMKSTRPDPARPFSKSVRLYFPPSIFHPITSLFPSSPLSFQLSHFPSLIIAPKNHLSLIIIIYLSVLLLSVSTLPESFSVCLLLHFQGMCLYIYTYLSCILVLLLVLA